MVKIRLQREGKKKAPFYHIVVADSRSPRDGKIIEQIGTYDPMTEPSTIVLNKEKLDLLFSQLPHRTKRAMIYYLENPGSEFSDYHLLKLKNWD